MKGKKVVLAVLLLGCLGASATESQTIQVGLTGGLNSSTIRWSTNPLGDEPGELDRRHSVTGGVVLTVSGPGNLRLRTEVLLTGKGFSETRDDGAVRQFGADYVEIPILIGLSFPSGSFVPEVYAGPWVGRETSCSLGLDSGQTVLAYDCDEIPGGPLLRETTDWGVAVGAVMTTPAVGRLRGFVDLRYSAGLRNLDKSASIENMNLKHRGYSVALVHGSRR